MNITSVFVTHDQEEALEVADRVVVMNRGRIEQLGTPEEVYDHPASPFVYGFSDDVNRLARGDAGGSSAEVAFVRPHDLEVRRHIQADSVRAVVEHVIPIKPTVRLELRDESGSALEAELAKERYAISAWVRASPSSSRPASTRCSQPKAPPLEAAAS